MKTVTQTARDLRNNPTEAEKKLWLYLRADQTGYRFRRQFKIGPYIADLACPEKNLVIEVDGGQHSEQVEYDRRRSDFFEQRGYKTLRFWNNDVLSNTEGVMTQIL